MNECIAVNIQGILEAIGEEELQGLLSGFSSPLNGEVEDFAHNIFVASMQEIFAREIIYVRNSKKFE